MTAEIAILNKSAIVLAADSAVTLDHGSGFKIFNTADKIFELSSENAIGLMVYNRLDFMDLPIEVLSKEYRRKRRNCPFATVKECQEDFFDFLTNEVAVSDDDKTRNFSTIVLNLIDRLSSRFDRKLSNYITQKQRVLVSKFNGVLSELLDETIQNLEAEPYAEGFSKVTISADEKIIIDNISNDCFRQMQLTQKNKTKLYRIIALSISKKPLSFIKTGLVFAGFGSNEICPTLIQTEIDGILSGKLKASILKEIDVGRTGPAADVLGFAQDDMVQTFINGIDPSLQEYGKSLFSDAIRSSARAVLSPAFPNEPKQVDKIMKGVEGDLRKLQANVQSQFERYIQRFFTSEVKDMVRSMPKTELATLAESLIEITSLKRKVTRDKETVGGEVDVAVISKSEGLVWVKRKHYFPPELNSRFFQRRSTT